MPSYLSPLGTEIHVSADEQAGARALKRGGPKARERAIWAVLTEQLEYQMVFDLGANYGQVTLEAIYPSETTIVLVEANPALLSYLERTVAGHPNRTQVLVHNVALGDEDGEIDLYVRHDAVGKSSVIREEGERVTVPLSRLDSLVPLPDGVRKAIIKLDVEGSELAALRGAAPMLERLDDYAIMVELHPGYMRQTAGSLGHYLEMLCAYGRLWERAPAGHWRTFNLHGFVRRNELTDIVIVSGADYDQKLRTHSAEVRERLQHEPPASPEARSLSKQGDRRGAPTRLRDALRRRITGFR